MTREDFDSIDTWYELEQVARDYGYEDEFEYVYTSEAYEDRVRDHIKDMVDNCDRLNDIKRELDELPDANYYDRYIEDDYDDTWRGTDDDDSVFRDYKESLFDRLDENDEFEQEYEDEDIEPDYEDEDISEEEPEDEELENTGFDLNQVFEVLDSIDCEVAQAEEALSEIENDPELQEAMDEAVCEELEEEMKQAEEAEEESAELEELFA